MKKIQECGYFCLIVKLIKVIEIRRYKRFLKHNNFAKSFSRTFLVIIFSGVYFLLTRCKAYVLRLSKTSKSLPYPP